MHDEGTWLRVAGLELQCTLGVTARERRQKQTIEVNVDILVDAPMVAASDAIADTVDYRLVARRIAGLVEASSYRLVETLATHLAAAVFAEFPRVRKLRLEIWKPGALRGARAVGTTLVAPRPGPPVI